MISRKTLSSLKKDVVSFLFRAIRRRKIILNGVRLHCDRKVMSNQVIEAMLRKTYEQPEYNSIRKNLEASDVVLEMGGGVGYISLQCSKVVGSGNIHVYEASPDTADLALRNFSLNGREITLHRKILGSSSGRSTFYVNESFESSSLLKRDGIATEMMVERDDVNDVIKRIRPTFLIVDIEGGEAELIPKTNLGDIKKISIEVHPHVIGDDEVNSTVLHILNEGFLIDWASSAKKVLFFYRPETR